MKLQLYFLAAVLTAALAPYSLAQRGGAPPDPLDRLDLKLPNGKSQRDEIVKADHKRNKEDAVKLADLSSELREELAASDSHVVSVKTIKKAEEIEKLARGIRSRLRRN